MALGNITISLTIDEQYVQGLDKAEKKAQETGDKIEKSLNNAFGKNLEKFGARIEKIGTSITNVGIEASKISIPIIAAFGLSTNAAVQFDDQLASVRKSTGATGDEIKAIGKEFLNLSKNTRTSAEDLTRIATIGGQIGVGAKEIVPFTDAVNKLTVALGDEFLGGAEQVTQEVGVLRQIFKDIKTDKIDEDLLRIGNAINTLGAEGLATGPVVADFASRIGGLTSNLGNRAGDILGLSATLQELGVTAERGGSAVGRILQELAASPAKFAKIVGVSSKEFAKLVDTDINAAFIKVLEGVNRSADSATEFAAVLEDLELTGVGNAEVFSKLSQNTDLLAQKQALANKALGSTNSILNEYTIKNNTAQANVEKLRNRFTALGVTIGDAVLPRLVKIVDGIGSFVDTVAQKFEELPAPVQDFIINIGLVVAALGPLLLIIGSLVSAFGTISTALGVIAPLFAGISLATVGWVAVIALLVAGLVALANRFGFLQKVGEKIQIVFDSLKKTWDNLVEAFNSPQVQESLKKLEEAFNKLQDAFKPIFDSLGKALDKIFKPFSDQLGENEGALFSVEGAINFLVASIDGLIKVIEFLTPIIDGISKAIAFGIDIWTNWDNIINQASATLAGFILKVVGAAISIRDGIVSAFNRVVSFFTNDIPNAIQTGINFVIAIWNNLPEIAGRIAFDVGVAFGNIINFFRDLSGNIQTFLTQFWNFLVLTFTNAKDFAIQKTLELYNGVLQFFRDLPANTVKFLENTRIFVVEKFTALRDFAINKASELVNGVVGFFQQLPSKAQTEADNMRNNIVNTFNDITTKAYNFGRDLVNKVVDGIKSVGNKIGETWSSITSNFGAGFNSTQNKSQGGVIQRFAKGGMVKKVAYAASGMFVPKGTDTVPAMLTPGEMVLPKGLTSSILGILKQIGNLPNVSSIAGNGAGGVGNLQFNVGTLNAGNVNEARKRSGDLGWGVYQDLRSRGLI